MNRSSASEIALDVQAALGREPVDLVVKNCRLINVYAQEIHPADLAILRGRIVAVRETFSGPAARIVDAQMQFVAPMPIGTKPDEAPAQTLRDHQRVTSFAEARQAIRHGKTAFLDESIGSESLAEILAALKRERIDGSALCFAFGAATPLSETLHPIRLALRSGFSAPEAFQIGALNPATHFCVDDVRGSLAPGRRADIVFLESLSDLQPVRVILAGREVTFS
jgi:adenine deaminase